MTPREIIAGCQSRRVFCEDGIWHAECEGCDVGASGSDPVEAMRSLETIIGIEIQLALEAVE